MNTLFAEYPTINGVNSDAGALKVLIAPTSDDDTKVRFNVAQIVEGKVKANVCALITKEIAELFVHQLTTSCTSTLPKCECGDTLEVL